MPPWCGVVVPPCFSLTAVLSDSYEGGRSSWNLMDRRVLVLLLPGCCDLVTEPTVLDRLTCPLLPRMVLDRLTSPALLAFKELDRLTPFSSCVESTVPLLLWPAGCWSNEKAVLLLLLP